MTEGQKFAAPLGSPPELLFVSPDGLRIDPIYQRDLSAKSSKKLIERIAAGWDWNLCLPLVVARRSDFIERLFVIDGQHRLMAARIRGDIAALPCVVGEFDGVAGEAQGFVSLNSVRRALTQLDLFKARLASGDADAVTIADMLGDAGMSLAPHTNATAWKPGQVANVGGIGAAVKAHGEPAVRAALRIMNEAYRGQVLRYAGSILPGVAALCADFLALHDDYEAYFERVQTMLVLSRQEDWRAAALTARIDYPGLSHAAASALAFRRGWASYAGVPSQPAAPAAALKVKAPAAEPVAPAIAGGWCDQCDMKVSAAEAAACKSKFCSFRRH